MRALWLEDGQLRVRDDVPTPRLAPGEAVVRVSLAGVCNTDLELVAGYYPYSGVPGHEFVGSVESADDDGEWRGRRVVAEINAACRRCETCLAGRPTHCPERTVLGIVNRDGAFATHLRVPVANLRAVPDSLPDELAVFTEPLAAALEIQEQVTLSNRDRVVVVGPGKLGSLVAQSLAAAGCDLVVAGRRPEPLARLAARGIHTAAVDELAPRRADVVVECTGDPAGLEVARRAVRPRGTIVLKSTYRGRSSVDLSAFVVDEITIVGSRCGPFDPALALLARGAVDPRPLIEARYPLARAVDAFAHAARPGALKVLVDCR